jgi:hypothetical protein
MSRWLPMVSVLLMMVAVLVVGCGPNIGPDENKQVFVTATQVASSRQAVLVKSWRDTAASILRTHRPDLAVEKLEPFALKVSGDGYQETIDLMPLEPKLSVRGAVPQPIIREYLLGKLPQFDQRRLKSAGFEKVRTRIAPFLLSRRELTDYATAIGSTTKPVHANDVIGSVVWAPAVFASSSDAAIVGPDLLDAWHMSVADVDRVAQDNLRSSLNDTAIETMGSTEFVGSIARGTNPAIIVMPEFLPLVRRLWKTDDDLVMVIASRSDIRFVCKNDRKTQQMLASSWQKAMSDPASFSRSLLELSSKGFAIYVPPATQPVTKPASLPATKPATRIYIVH